MNLLLVRHGEIPSNVSKIYAGSSPERLTPRGELQAKEVARKLTEYNIDALYTSPVERARQTAGIIGGKIGKDALIENAFREIEMGPWEGMSEDEVAGTYPEEWAIWMSRPADLQLRGRETLDALLKRVLSGVHKICNKTGGRNLLIVTHVAIIRVLLLWHSNKSLNLYKTVPVSNAEIFSIALNDCSRL